jgi:hypothetical protein
MISDLAPADQEAIGKALLTLLKAFDIATRSRCSVSTPTTPTG